MTSLIPDFTTYLRELDRATLTIQGYVADVQLFAKWFKQTNDEVFAPPAITPSDVREYRQHLLNVDQRKANTTLAPTAWAQCGVNRKLAALSVFMQFAIETHLIEHDPTRQIKHVEESPRGPKYLDKQQQFALQRAIEKDLQYSQARYPRRWLSRRRDASLVLFLWHTGLRVSEAIALTKRDVQLSERKGQVTVRGKGTKQRTVPLNSEARQALQAWLGHNPHRTEVTYAYTCPGGQCQGAPDKRLK